MGRACALRTCGKEGRWMGAWERWVSMKQAGGAPAQEVACAD